MTTGASPEPPPYPAGPFAAGDGYDDRRRQAWMDEIERAPARLREVVSGLSDPHVWHARHHTSQIEWVRTHKL